MKDLRKRKGPDSSMTRRSDTLAVSSTGEASPEKAERHTKEISAQLRDANAGSSGDDIARSLYTLARFTGCPATFKTAETL